LLPFWGVGFGAGGVGVGGVGVGPGGVGVGLGTALTILWEESSKGVGL